jgi:hypothetical protein
MELPDRLLGVINVDRSFNSEFYLSEFDFIESVTNMLLLYGIKNIVIHLRKVTAKDVIFIQCLSR